MADRRHTKTNFFALNITEQMFHGAKYSSHLYANRYDSQRIAFAHHRIQSILHGI
jgi:hypothetical protein